MMKCKHGQGDIACLECLREIENRPKQNSDLNDLLYGVVQWINGIPILDGMEAFITKEKAIDKANEWQKGPIPQGVELKHTIITIKKAI